jgi:hypothetical protein
MIINSTTQKSSSFESLSLGQQVELINYVNGLIQGALAFRKKFTTADLVGGKFRNWSHTPLDYVYQYHLNRNIDNPEVESGKDIGRIVKYIMSIDKYRVYRIVGEEQRKYPINLYELVKIKD